MTLIGDPKVPLQVNASIIFEPDTLSAEALLHDVRRFKVPASCQSTIPVHDPMGRKSRPCRCVQGPTDRPRRPPGAQEFGNVPIGGDATRGDLCHHLPDTIEKIVRHAAYWLPSMIGRPSPPLPITTVLAFGEVASCCVASMPLNRRN